MSKSMLLDSLKSGKRWFENEFFEYGGLAYTYVYKYNKNEESDFTAY